MVKKTREIIHLRVVQEGLSLLMGSFHLAYCRKCESLGLRYRSTSRSVKGCLRHLAHSYTIVWKIKDCICGYNLLIITKRWGTWMMFLY